MGQKTVRILLMAFPLWGQHSLRMGARLHLNQSRLVNSTDQKAPSLIALRPTYRPGLSGFFIWGWSGYWGTGIEIAYQGAGQNYYGVGLNGQSYGAAVRLSYLRLSLPFQVQYQWSCWGLWGQVGPSAAALTQVEYTYQGDSIAAGSLYAPQVMQNILNYLSQSTNPEEQLLLMRLYRRWNWGIAAAGGVKSRLAPGVWILALISYQRDLTDAENKGYRLSSEGPPAYHPRRKPTYNEQLGLQVGILYEMEHLSQP